MIGFAGWSMPVQYTGIIQEHLHTREKAGLFDTCHMGELSLSGPQALQDIDRLVTCRIHDLEVGRCRYGFLLGESGGILDDLIIFRTGESDLMLVVNAGATDKDHAWITSHISPHTKCVDASGTTAKLDIQGPFRRLRDHP